MTTREGLVFETLTVCRQAWPIPSKEGLPALLNRSESAAFDVRSEWPLILIKVHALSADIL